MAILNYYAVTTNPIKYWLAYLIKVFGYSSLIFMFSMHTAYCFIDILLVALTISSSFKYVQQDEDSIYLYHQKPTQ